MPEVLTKMDQLLHLLRRESTTTTPALDMRPSTTHDLVTLPVEKFGFDVLERRRPIRRSAGDECDRRRGSGANAQDMHLQGKSFTDSLSDLSDRNFTPSSPVQARITGPSSDEREEGIGGGVDADGVGLSRRC